MRSHLVVLAVTAPGWLLGAVTASAAPTPLPCDEPSIRAAVANGGSYAFSADCHTALTHGPQTVAAGKDVTLDANGHNVILDGSFDASLHSVRFFDVTGGSLTLKGLHLYNGRAAPFSAGSFLNGLAGDDGDPGTSRTCFTGGAATAGERGDDGHLGSITGTPAGDQLGRGGAVLVTAGTLTVDHTELGSNRAQGLQGGDGFDGGPGGAGGAGGDSCGPGAAGGKGGDGGEGTAGGDAYGQSGDGLGGAIYNAADGTVHVVSSTFVDNWAVGGRGGCGGDGGKGGNGGRGGIVDPADGLGGFGPGTPGDGGTGGVSGDGGRAGSPGSDGRGGAIYNAGTLTIDGGSFTTNRAIGGDGGCGGGGGEQARRGAAGADNRNFTQGQVGGIGRAGNGGAGSDGGDGVGGAVYSKVTFTRAGIDAHDDMAIAGEAGRGGAGGAGANNQIGSQAGQNGTDGAAGQAIEPEILGSVELRAGSRFAEQKADAETTVDIPVQAVPAPQETVTVHYATQAGTAVAGTDFVPVSGDLTFPAGAETRTVTVRIPKSPADHEDRRFQLVLSNPVNATVGENATVVVGKRPLSVTVEPERKTVELADSPDGPVPQDVPVKVTVTSHAATPITGVTLPPILSMSSDQNLKVCDVLKNVGTMDDTAIGTLQPGQSAVRSYTIRASQDGAWKLQATASGTVDGRAVSTTGEGDFEPKTKLLEIATKMGDFRLGKGGLAKAGYPYTIRLTVKNLSCRKHLAVAPFWMTVAGNGTDGHVQKAGGAVSLREPDGSLDEVQASQAMLMAPKETRELEAVVHTFYSQPDLESDKQAPAGTRSVATLERPDFGTVAKDNEHIDLEDAGRLVVRGDESYTVRLDDSAPPHQPGSYWDAAYYTTEGFGLAMVKYSIGTVQGILGLPGLAVSGVKNLVSWSPPAKLLEQMVEQWEVVKDDPELRRQYLDIVSAKVLGAYEEIPEVVAKKKKEIEDAYVAKLTAMYNEYEAGDWQAGLRDITSEGFNQGFNAVSLAVPLGVGVANRFKAIATALKARRAKAAARTEQLLQPLARTSTQSRNGARALRALKDGAPLKGASGLKEAQNLFGVSAKTLERLIDYCKANRIRIVLRSRAVEALEQIERAGAWLKAPPIYTKTVNFIDTEALGWPDSLRGLVALRSKLPTLKEVQSRLGELGIAKGSPEYAEAIAWLRKRRTSMPDELKQMREWAGRRESFPGLKGKHGYMESRYDWKANQIQPLFAESSRRIPFRLRSLAGDVELPEVFIDGRWRPIAGDVDLVAIVDDVGRPLGAVKHQAHLENLERLSGSPHGDTAYWAWLKNGKRIHDFEKKREILFPKNGEKFLEVNPDGLLITSLNEKLTRLGRVGHGSRPLELWFNRGYRHLEQPSGI